MTPKESDNNIITVKSGEARPLSAHHRVIQEVGEDLIRQSLVTGREFCKYMISTSTGAIPLYIALLSFAAPHRRDSGSLAVLATVPAVLYLVAMVLFAAGYQPSSGVFSLDAINEIESFRDKILRRRKTLIALGFSFFVLATLWASVVIILN